MGDGLRTVRVITTDDGLLASARSAVESIPGWEVAHLATQDELLTRQPVRGDVLLIDSWLRGRNVYEFCRLLAGRTRCRTYVVTERENHLAQPIARFCGATGVISRPLTRSALMDILEADDGEIKLASDQRDGAREMVLPEALLADLTREQPTESGLIQALIDSETGLFSYAFLHFKLDEEFKRARRFDQPLACVMLGFDGQCSNDVLRELAAIFLEASRDTDLIGRFDENSFLFLLPNTGLDGATIMAGRVASLTEERDLADLVGDQLVISVGISCYPHPDIEDRDQLYGNAREAFFNARNDGGGVVCVT
ncbi:MAG: diguanylate cyclase (GGDEF)-like protein [Chlamydiales bacterium]|jgi:diguanylate cyclase (GGDEF)-like protein